MSRFEPVSALLNREVIDGRGEFVGWLREILVDSAIGRIEYARISLSSGNGGRRSVVVPWSALRRTDDRSRPWQVAARRQTLRRLATREPKHAAILDTEDVEPPVAN